MQRYGSKSRIVEFSCPPHQCIFGGGGSALIGMRKEKKESAIVKIISNQNYSTK